MNRQKLQNIELPKLKGSKETRNVRRHENNRIYGEQGVRKEQSVPRLKPFHTNHSSTSSTTILTSGTGNTAMSPPRPIKKRNRGLPPRPPEPIRKLHQQSSRTVDVLYINKDIPISKSYDAGISLSVRGAQPPSVDGQRQPPSVGRKPQMSPPIIISNDQYGNDFIDLTHSLDNAYFNKNYY